MIQFTHWKLEYNVQDPNGSQIWIFRAPTSTRETYEEYLFTNLAYADGFETVLKFLLNLIPVLDEKGKAQKNKF